MAYTPPAYDPEGGDFGPITPGIYGGAAEALEVRMGPKGYYVAWTFILIEGEFKNRKVWNNTTLNPDNINMPGGFYKSVIAAMGDEEGEALVEEMQGIDFDDEEGMVEWVAERVISRLVDLAIANRKYENKIQNDVQNIRAYTGDTPQLDTAEMAATKKAPAKKGAKKTGKASAKDDMGF